MSFFITVERVKFAQTIVNRVKIAFINSSASWVDDIYEFVTIGSKTDCMQLISAKATPVIKMKHFLSV